MNPQEANAYQTAFMSGGLWGLTNEWVLRDMKETPEEMEALFSIRRSRKIEYDTFLRNFEFRRQPNRIEDGMREVFRILLYFFLSYMVI